MGVLKLEGEIVGCRCMQRWKGDTKSPKLNKWLRLCDFASVVSLLAVACCAPNSPPLISQPICFN